MKDSLEGLNRFELPKKESENLVDELMNQD